MATRLTPWFSAPRTAVREDWDVENNDHAVREETVRPFKPRGINYLLMCKSWGPIFVPPEEENQDHL
jgi:hypothetical protein